MIAIIMFASASVGTQLGALATRFVNASRILGLFGVTVLNAGVAVGLGQLARALDAHGWSRPARCCCWAYPAPWR